MRQPLPVSDFKWMKEKDLDNWKELGCILEVDLEQAWPTSRSRSTGRSPSVSWSIAPDFALN